MRRKLIACLFLLPLLAICPGFSQVHEERRESEFIPERTKSSRCENFWKFACEHPEAEWRRKVPERRKVLKEAYEQQLQEEFNRHPDHQKYIRELQRLSQSVTPSWKKTAAETIEAFQQEWTPELKQALMAPLRTPGTPVPLATIFMTEVIDRYVKDVLQKHYSSDPHKLKEIVDSYDWGPSTDYAAQNLQFIEKILNDLEKLPDSHELLRRFSKDVIEAVYKAGSYPIEYAIEGQLAFKKAVAERVFPKEKRQRVEELLRQAMFYADPSAPMSTLFKPKDLKDVSIVWPGEERFPGYIGIWAYEANAEYEPNAKKIVVYGDYATASDEEIFRTVAHEYGHAVLRLLPSERHDKLKKCLSSSQSMGCLPHQLEECIADWYAAEAAARYLIKSKAHASPEEKLRFLVRSIPVSCEPVESYREVNLLGPSTHPRWDKRANRIMMAHPKLREFAGCSREENSVLYCGLNGAEK